MTELFSADERPVAPPPPGSVLPAVDEVKAERLAQLHAQYRILDDQSKVIEVKLKAVKDSIKAECTAIVGDDGRPFEAYQLPLGDTLTYQVSKRLDTKTFDAAFPGLRAKYSNASGAWVLRRGKG